MNNVHIAIVFSVVILLGVLFQSSSWAGSVQCVWYGNQQICTSVDDGNDNNNNAYCTTSGGITNCTTY